MDFPKKTEEYDDLKIFTEPWGITYGPFQSRRLGLSLGINLVGSGEKVCSYDCPYCELGFTRQKMSQMKKMTKFPSLQEIDEELRSTLVLLTQKKTALQTLTISGNGEPTLHPDFSEVTELICKIRNDLCPKVRIVALSNGSTLDSTKTVRGLNLLDERMLKLDAGNDEMLAKINAPLVRMSISKLIQRAKKLADVSLQSFFVQGVIDNTVNSEVDDWIEVVGVIKPKAVHIYGLDRVPALPGLRQAPRQKLKEIAQRLEKRTLIKAQVFS